MSNRKKFLSASQLVGYTNLMSKTVYPSEYYSGAGSVMILCEKIISDGARKIFVTADSNLKGSDVISIIRSRLRSVHISFFLYTKAAGSMTIKEIKKCSELFRKKHCDSILCLGGAASMNFSKLLSHSVLSSGPSKRKKNSQNYYSRHIPFYAVPSEECSGHESTMFAKVYDERAEKHISVCVSKTLPSVIALDPNVNRDCRISPHDTALAGMDALAAAVESYIGTFSDKFTVETQKAPAACRMIFENLYTSYLIPENSSAALKLLKAYHYAGISMRHAGAGYVYSLASRLEEMYSVPHGLSSAVLLPVVLEYYFPKCTHDLSMLAYLCRFTENKTFENENARLFINEIKKLRREVGISNRISVIRPDDINTIIERTQKEAHLQGCPKFLTDKQLREILENIS